MDDLLREFLTETNESLDVLDVELVRFEQQPNNAAILDNIFRLVHTIKGTCGFLSLVRLEALAHAAETLMGQFRAGKAVTVDAVSLILLTIDRIKELLGALERDHKEPDGADHDVIAALELLAQTAAPPAHTESAPAPTVCEPQAPQAHAAVAPHQGEPSAAVNESERGERIAGQSIRVNLDTLDHLMTMVSELVLTRNQLLEIARRHPDSEFKVPLQRLSSVTGELQEGVMKTRMQPIGNAWQKLPRIVRDLATDLGKQIELELVGAETELDRQVLDLIKDPLTHMVRNCAAHGIESPQQRLAAGKTEWGTVRLCAHHRGGHIIIEIADDGRGLDLAAIRASAIARGLASESELDKMSESQLQRFIFAPGFTTTAAVTSIAGRGVGMDVARSNIDSIGGTIDVRSISGEGTTFVIKIPLTMAIVSALIVEAGGERFAIPQLAVIELVRVRANSEHRVDWLKDTPVLRSRNRLLPLVHLKKLLAIDPSPTFDAESGFIVVLQIGSDMFGIVVDGVLQTEEIVVKPMSQNLSHIAMFSGNTILGDGSVIMIIDPHGIAAAIGTSGGAQSPGVAEAEEERHAAEERTTPMLLFRAGPDRQKAVPLSLVTRLEEVDARSMEASNGQHLLQYRGQLMPLVPANSGVRIRSEGTQPLVVFSDEEQSMGLLVDEIVDIVDDPLDIEITSDRPGVLGSAVIKGMATEVIDVSHYLPLAFGPRYGRVERRNVQQRKVLLVDDQAFFRNLLTPILGAAGYAVTAVPSAGEALALIKAGERFDAVVTDLDMPETTGFELAQTLRDDPLTAGVPVIGLTPVDSPDMARCALQFGARDCVAKFDRNGLISALESSRAPIEQAA
jgi:two-component system chemotaxis sensor kinase CheA